jgi:AraC family transcriptional regulator, regulatory protein of adaptative response / methylated-DNA-[protein]-cysteine methyltransferase
MNTQANPSQFLDEAACWQAVQARDEQFDGRFYYGVRSTGVYCRPSCPSRRPGRAQVRFYPTRAAAEADGFRPCRRCRPDLDLTPRAELVARAVSLIESSPDPLTLEALGKALHASPFHLQRVFKAATGLSPRQYAAGLRAGRFKQELRGGSDVTGALYEAGYGSSSRMYEESTGRLGMSPTDYRSLSNGKISMHIQYTIVDCPLGRLLVAATDKGVCAVSLGSQDAALESALRAEYPAAEILPAPNGDKGGAGMQGEVRSLLDYLSGAQPGLDLPLDLRATAFKLRVWEELRRIPYGETRTYAQVAAAIGSTKAVRAVGNACATNPAALVNPCHRVIRADGSLGGYRWGLERKRALLAAEHSQLERVHQEQTALA